METTDRVSRSIIDDERVQREKKTARLQIARLERDATAEAPAKAAGKTAAKAKSRKR